MRTRRILRQPAVMEVEAETDGEDGAVLTAVSVPKRRELVDRYGDHNVHLSLEDLLRVGFPFEGLMYIVRGYPVRFPMVEETFEAMVVNGPGFDGLHTRRHR